MIFLLQEKNCHLNDFFCSLEIPYTILHGESYFHSIFILVNTHANKLHK